MTKPAILFVDDSENILQGLRRNLRPVHQQWDVYFAVSGEAALKLMQEKHIDVIVSDVRMPGMHGPELLKRVKEAYGHTVRMVLSGQCEEESILKLLEVSHRYMAKPCDTAIIISSIQDVLASRERLQDEGLKKFITQLTALPTLPSLHEEIIAELQMPAPAAQKLEDLFLRDISFMARLIQVMNSSYFGTTQDLHTIAYVWELLGVEKIKHLILRDHIIAPLNKDLGNDPFIRDLWQMSLITARIARAIVKSENLPQKLADKVYVIGLLHAIGALVLYEYRRQQAQPTYTQNLWAIEAARDTYPVAGEFLLSLWGLPRDICYVVLNHAMPDKAIGEGDKNLLGIIHVARAIARARIYPEETEEAHLNREFLKETCVLDKMENWKKAADLI